MRIFVGYGYNDRDRWIEDAVFSILRVLGFEILHGKDMHGEVLADGVKERIRQSDALIGFCTLRPGHEGAAFNTHPWVRDEIVFALGLGKAILEVREEGVNNPEGIVGNRQRVNLRPADRMACVIELAQAVSRWNMRTLQLVAPDDDLTRRIHQSRKDARFQVQYRTRAGGVDSAWQPTRMELVKGSFYMPAFGLSLESLIEIEGRLDGVLMFSSGWEPTDVVQVRVS